MAKKLVAAGKIKKSNSNAHENLDRPTQVNLSTAQKEAIDAAAEKLGMSISTFLRTAALEKVERVRAGG